MSDDKTDRISIGKDFVRVFLVPMIVNKIAILYFGAEYAENPGEGYGYGLCAALLLLVINFGVFLWRYRDVQDP
jgi:hypothetical protein